MCFNPHNQPYLGQHASSIIQITSHLIPIRIAQYINKQEANKLRSPMSKLNRNHHKSSGNITHKSKPSLLNNKIANSSQVGKEHDYVRIFFQRRNKLEEKVREKIFKDGRNNSKMRDSIKNREITTFIEPTRCNNSEKKQANKKLMTGREKVESPQKKFYAKQNKQLDDERSSIKHEIHVEKIKEDGATKTTKSQSRGNQLPKDHLNLFNFDGVRQLKQKAQTKYQFKQIGMKRSLGEGNQKNKHKCVENQQNFILTNQRFKPCKMFNQDYFAQCHYPFYQKQETQINGLQHQFRNRNLHKLKGHSEVDSSKQIEPTGYRCRSKGFKNQIGPQLRNKLANMIFQQKLKLKIRNQKAQSVLQAEEQKNQDNRMEKLRLALHSEQQLDQLVAEHKPSSPQVPKNEKIQLQNCETGLKKVDINNEDCKQQVVAQQLSEILCAICQTNIPHDLWKNAMFYDKNRVEYYKFYELFFSETEKHNSKPLDEEEDNDDSIVPLLLHCGHSFHRICLEEWFRYKTVCPLCKTELDSAGGNDHQQDDYVQDYEQRSSVASYDEPPWSQQDSPYYESVSYEEHSNQEFITQNPFREVGTTAFNRSNGSLWIEESNSEPSELSFEQVQQNRNASIGNQHYPDNGRVRYVRHQRLGNRVLREYGEEGQNQYQRPNESRASSESEEPSQNWESSDSQFLYEHNIQ